MGIKSYWQLIRFRKEFRKNNGNNYVIPVNIFNTKNVVIGNKTYGDLYVNDWGTDNTQLIIGNYCSIGPGVRFLLCSEHYTNTITTYPLKNKILNMGLEAKSKGNIIIKDDVWIGANAIINSGITIGQGAIVAAGAVVTKDVEPYSIVGGVPAKVINYRFEREVINKLLEVDLKGMLDKVNTDNFNLFYKKINKENIDDILTHIKGSEDE